ncbi:hypothetical protein BKA62DRAFT_779208 [Auriculariales sp. MPI-PUGE-AT-0066]|nr:hypothetical protein BKA62DRAFT_779208 [Auriculariales sp. MPI-PUGE-AT-0066]
MSIGMFRIFPTEARELARATYGKHAVHAFEHHDYHTITKSAMHRFARRGFGYCWTRLFPCAIRVLLARHLGPFATAAGLLVARKHWHAWVDDHYLVESRGKMLHVRRGKARLQTLPFVALGCATEHQRVGATSVEYSRTQLSPIPGGNSHPSTEHDREEASFPLPKSEDGEYFLPTGTPTRIIPYPLLTEDGYIADDAPEGFVWYHIRDAPNFGPALVPDPTIEFPTRQPPIISLPTRTEDNWGQPMNLGTADESDAYQDEDRHPAQVTEDRRLVEVAEDRHKVDLVEVVEDRHREVVEDRHKVDLVEVAEDRHKVDLVEVVEDRHREVVEDRHKEKPSHKKNHVKEPERFKGDKEKTEDFVYHLQLYLAGTKGDAHKIRTTLSYLSDEADNWGQAWDKANMAAVNASLISFADFMKDFEKYFTDPQLREKAELEMKGLRIGYKETAQAFFVKFNRHRIRSVTDDLAHDYEHVKHLERTLPQGFVSQIKSSLANGLSMLILNWDMQRGLGNITQQQMDAQVAREEQTFASMKKFQETAILLDPSCRPYAHETTRTQYTPRPTAPFVSRAGFRPQTSTSAPPKTTQETRAVIPSSTTAQPARSSAPQAATDKPRGACFLCQSKEHWALRAMFENQEMTLEEFESEMDVLQEEELEDEDFPNL